MNASVHLHIVPERINPKRWRVVYQETLALLSHYSGRLMGVRREIMWHSERTVFTASLERGEGASRHWLVTGDFETLCRGDQISLFADLDHYSQGKEGNSPDPDGKPLDILRDRDTEYRKLVFSGITGNKPYLIPVLACGMLMEQAFPGDALVGGHFRVGHAQQAQKLLKELIHRDVPLPVVADSERLWRRVTRFAQGTDALDRFEERYRGTADEIHLELRKYAEPDLVAGWWAEREADERALKAVADRVYMEEQEESASVGPLPTSIGEFDNEHHRALLDLVQRVQGLREEGLSTEDPIFTRPAPEIKERIVRLSDEHGVYLSENAWAWIDAEEELPVLTVVLLLIAINVHEPSFYETRWALLEQRETARHFAEITYRELN